MSTFGPTYTTTAASRAAKMKAKIAALEIEQQQQIKKQLQQLQQQQVNEINQLLANVGISDPVTSVEEINTLFSNFGLSGGRKSRRRKTIKSMKSRRRR